MRGTLCWDVALVLTRRPLSALETPLAMGSEARSARDHPRMNVSPRVSMFRLIAVAFVFVCLVRDEMDDGLHNL